MTDTDGTAAKRRIDVAFLQCFDATVFAEPVIMTAAEEQHPALYPQCGEAPAHFGVAQVLAGQTVDRCPERHVEGKG